MMRTASIKLLPTPEQLSALTMLQIAYGDACNRLAAQVVEHRCWNRVALHNLAYRELRKVSPLGSQMVCNAIFSVCKAYKAQKSRGRIVPGKAVPAIHFRRPSVHYDHRTYTLRGESVSLYSLGGRIPVEMRMGEHQRRILDSGSPKEADLVCRNGQWFLNLVVEIQDPEPTPSGSVLGVDVGENNLAATSTGKVWGGGAMRHRRDQHLALRRRLQSNGSQSARQLLCKVSGKEQRHARQVNHETSKAIVTEARRIGAAKITMENLTHFRDRTRAGKRVRGRLHRWSFRQLQAFVEYKANAAGIAVEYVDPAFTSRACSACGRLGWRAKHRFVCSCGFRAHADCNASRNLARIGGGILPPRADVRRPHVGDVVSDSHAVAP